MTESDSKNNDPHKVWSKSNIPHSEKKKNLPKTLSCSNIEIHTTGRTKKAACDRKRKARLLARSMKHQTPGPVMLRSFPPFCFFLSLSHTGLGTSNVSNGEGSTQNNKYICISIISLWEYLPRHQVSSREKVLREYQMEWWGHFPLHWQCFRGSFTLRKPHNGICATIIFPTTWNTQGAAEVLEEWLLSGQN